MATIQSTIRLRDQMSGTLNIINQKIKQVTASNMQMNSSMKNTSASMGGLTGKIAGLASAYSGLVAAQKMVELSDEITLSTARLDLMNQRLAEGNKPLQTTAELQQDIYEAAQRSRSSYTGMMKSVSKMGLLTKGVFKNTKELVAFNEILNKSFVVGGSSSREQAMAMYQLTQAMGSGRLQGDEYRSIIENAPLLAQYIEEYMRKVQKVPGTMKDWSREGMLTADVIKNAVFMSQEATDKAFNGMKLTWGQVFEQCKNIFVRFSNVVLVGINWIANHWNYIAPILFAVFGTVIVYYGILLGAKVAHAVASAAETAAIIALIIAQEGFNAALAACPLVWIIGLIMAVIAVIALVIYHVQKTGNETVSVVGVIAGMISWACAFIYNVVIGVINGIIQIVFTIISPFVSVIEWIVNAFNGGFNNIGGACANLIGQIIGWFLQLGKVVTKIIDAIFGTNWTAGLEGLRQNVTAWGKNEKAVTYDLKAPELKRKNLKAAYNNGYSWGKSAEEKFSYSATNPNGTGKTGAADLARTANATEKSSEDLKWLREIAERKAVNKFTTAEIKVQMTNNNSINKDMDLDGVVSYLEDKLTETLNGVAEGTHI